MPTRKPDDGKRVEQEFRIIDLKRQAEELAGGPITEGFSTDCPPEIEEFFWEQVVAFAGAPETTHRALLARDNICVPPPGTLSDEEITGMLEVIVEALARRRTYLDSTNHLSDRELYTRLWTELLDQPVPDFPPDMPLPLNTHFDLVRSGDEEDTALWLKYYADEDTRNRWAVHFPEFTLPPHENPRYDRDRHLPKPAVKPHARPGLPPPDR
jgi:hypothetical protein